MDVDETRNGIKVKIFLSLALSFLIFAIYKRQTEKQKDLTRENLASDTSSGNMKLSKIAQPEHELARKFLWPHKEMKKKKASSNTIEHLGLAAWETSHSSFSQFPVAIVLVILVCACF